MDLTKHNIFAATHKQLYSYFPTNTDKLKQIGNSTILKLHGLKSIFFTLNHHNLSPNHHKFQVKYPVNKYIKNIF